jgi:hypothetical protein
VCVPTFHDIEIDGEGRTAIRLAIEDRDHRQPQPAAAPADDIASAIVGSTVDLTTFDPPRPQPSTF